MSEDVDQLEHCPQRRRNHSDQSRAKRGWETRLITVEANRQSRKRAPGGSERGYGRSKLFRPRRHWSRVLAEQPRGEGRNTSERFDRRRSTANRLYYINGIDDFLRENPSTPIQLNLKRNGADVTVPFEPGPLVVGEVSQESPAARAGLRKGDVVLAIDQIPMKSTAAASEYIRHHGGQPVPSRSCGTERRST